MKHFYGLIIVSFLFIIDATSQTKTQFNVVCSNDSASLQTLFQTIANYPKNDKAQLAEIAKLLLEKPYIAKTLEADGGEGLVVNLQAFDCLTLVENSIALYKILQTNNLSKHEFCKALTHIRYRDGNIDQYPSRLHYWTDWAFDNQQKAILTNVSEKLGGSKRKFPVNFMSAHPQYYRQLTENSTYIEVVRVQENEISLRDFAFIPKDKLSVAEDGIESGDIIGFVSTIEGLDIAHTGIALRQNGVVRLIHASSDAKKVVISTNSLVEYTNSMRKHNGIVVLRLN